MHPSEGVSARVLVAHPEQVTRAALARFLSQSGYLVTQVGDLADLPRLAATEAVYPVILIAGAVGDRVARLDPTVLDTVAQLGRVSSLSQIILLIPASVDVDTCCQAIESGASDFVEINRGAVDEQVLVRRLEQGMQRYERQSAAAQSLHSAEPSDHTGIVAQSRAMADVIAHSARAAQVSDAPVLILGESGTGKQLLAELIHRLDPKRCDAPFLTVNCAAITGSLADSALFGHVKGAFTGATQERAGYFRAAHGGTILLDEIGELDPCLQPKLLRVLQEGLILPVGADVEKAVDVRVLAATNRPLEELVEDGRVRLDLYQRLNVISIEIPPLRERPEDIEALLPFFVRKYARYYDRQIVGVDRRVYEFLSTCSLEGNVRELENAVRRILALKTSGDEIVLTDIPDSLRRDRRPNGNQVVPREVIDNVSRLIEQGALNLPDFVAECERGVLANVLSNSKAPKSDLARKLGLSRRTFYNKRRRHGL
ncbi:MAG: sigma 54-interacting transcriptional regulator [Planctomycetota bacterium]